jgi:PAS domain-containing protein
VQETLRTAAARGERESLPKAFTLLDAVPIPAIVTRGPRHRVQAVNRAWHALRAPDEADEAGDLAALLPRPSLAVVTLADEAFRSGREQALSEVPLAARPGRAAWRYADVSAHPLRDGAAEVAGLTLFFTDASDRVELRARSRGR